MELRLNLGCPGSSSSDRDAIARSSVVIGGGTTVGRVKGDDCVGNYGYLRRLEDEIRKIEPFRRELPLCMILLESTIERFRTRTQQPDEEEEETEMAMPSIGELFPLKRKSDDGESGEVSRTGKKRISCDGDRGLFKSALNGGDGCDKPARLDCMSNSVGDNCNEVLLLQKKSGSCMKRDNGCSLSLMSPTSVLVNPAAANAKGNGSSRLVLGSSFLADQMKLQKKTHQQQRQQMTQYQKNQGMVKKQRRSWSPELHRSFLEALQKLGGSQATPKQIKETMKVQGLTNDEVKSHLQKYRLNIQRLPLPSNNPNPSNTILRKWNRRGEEEGEEEECRLFE